MQEENLYPVNPTIQQLMEDLNITATFTTDDPPEWIDPQMKDRSHWCVTFIRGEKTLDIGYSSNDEPVPDEVLSLVLMESQGIFETTFEEWATDYGYDLDSRRDERIYRAVLDNATRTKAFLGDDWDQFLKAD